MPKIKDKNISADNKDAMLKTRKNANIEDIRRTRTQRLVYNSSKFILWLIAKICFRVRFVGQENIPRKGPFILASNHSSYLDPPLTGMGVPECVNFLAKRELFTGKIGWWIKAVGAVPVSRGHGDIGLFRFAEKAFQVGEILVLFPEGTRSKDGCLQPMREGIGLIIHKTGVPVVPVGIQGAFEAMPRDAKFPKFNNITVRYGKPIDFSEKVVREPGRTVYREIADCIGAEIGKLLDQKEG